VGSHSKAAFFSFSRDKIISSVYGGMAVTNNDEIGKKLEQLKKEFGQPSNFWIFQQLLHPILLHYIILPVYNFLDLGKIFLVLSQWLHILSKAVSWQEKRGQRPDYFPKAMPNALAAMALNQFSKLDKFNNHRQKIAEFYHEELKDTSFILPPKMPNTKNAFLRFTVKHPKAHEIIYDAWHKQNILLGDWYTTPIAPFDTKIEELKYTPGSCKNAEELAKITLNLPTHINISQKDAERIVDFLKTWN
jgi:dTDP-4-amino-4,6-dideoxygalactose transaminase